MRPKRKRRGNSRYYFFFALALILTGLIGTGAYMFLVNVSWLNITQIRHSGNSIVPDSLITQKLSFCMGKNLLAVSSSEIRSQFESIARIKQIQVRKSLPHTLNITFQEYPAVLWLRSAEGDLKPINASAKILETFDGIAKEDLPIVGTFLPSAQLKPGIKLNKPYLNRILALHAKIGKEAPDFLPIISEYYMIDNTIHIVDTRYGTSIIPSENEIAAQLRRYLFVQDNGNINRRSTVDLRFDKQVVVKEGIQ